MSEDMTRDKALELLKGGEEGVKKWNQWRAENFDVTIPSLEDADLGEAHLEGAELWGANLSGANLSVANLSGEAQEHHGNRKIDQQQWAVAAPAGF